MVVRQGTIESTAAIESDTLQDPEEDIISQVVEILQIVLKL